MFAETNKLSEIDSLAHRRKTTANIYHRKLKNKIWRKVFYYLKDQDYKTLNIIRKVFLEDVEGEMFLTEIISVLIEEMPASHGIYVSKEP